MAGKFEVYENKLGEFRFRRKADSGEVVATGEGYHRQAAAHEGTEAAHRAADGAAVVDV